MRTNDEHRNAPWSRGACAACGSDILLARGEATYGPRTCESCEVADEVSAAWETRVAELEARLREARGLLRRMVKYVTEDEAQTPGFTRLARCTEQVRDYLTRTHNPSDVLRAELPKDGET